MAESLKSSLPCFVRALSIFTLVTAGTLATAQSVPQAPLTADQIMAKIDAMNDIRTQKLEGYTSIRTYRLESHGVVSKKAEMVVRADFRAPHTKEFTVISETGSATIRDRVFRHLLDAEIESMNAVNQQQTAMTSDNYLFTLVTRSDDDGKFYVIDIKPKIKNKFLFSGRIWIDPRDFAVTRIDGRPAVNPSWWTLRTDFTRQYERIGELWFPEATRSVTKVRMFGTAVMTIDYQEYQITQPGGATAAELSTPVEAEP